MHAVQFKNIEKSYGSTTVLRDINLDIEPGEFVALVGPSGCGKSTLLKILAGLEPPSTGEVYIGERPVVDLPPYERDVAMVFQNYALYPHMNVAGNLGFALKLAGLSGDEIERRVEQAAELLGLSDLLRRFPRQLSGGQRQRVAMGRAIVRQPKVFLFDEPLSNLDANLRVQMRAEIKALHQRLKITSLYVTHDQVEAMTMADRIVVLRDGVIQQIGSPLDVYDRPNNQFVAGFMGSPPMNFLSATVQVDRLVLADGQSLSSPQQLDIGRQITVGIRPENIALSETGLRATVVVVEPTGAETLLLVRLGGDQVNVVVRERVQIEAGQQIHLQVAANDVKLFNGTADSERLVVNA